MNTEQMQKLSQPGKREREAREREEREEEAGKTEPSGILQSDITEASSTLNSACIY
jgi:hypothetical protein